VHRFTPEGAVKPNPEILALIIDEIGFDKGDAAYVGDSLLKDISMAQQADVLDIHAAYGSAQHRTEQYDLLKKVTHWSPEMVRQEATVLVSGKVSPSFVIESSFSQIEQILKVTV